MSNPEAGQCPFCAKYCLYSEAHCLRCNNLLPWAFLIDPIRYKPETAPTIPWLTRFLDSIFNPSNKKPKCRYCYQAIESEARICPHCRRVLYVGGTNHGSILGGEMIYFRVDENSPVLKAMIDKYLEEYPDGV